ncbi:hypothetical protein [Photobacterium kishitanii]|uniref:Uncharacterized protein n=1 Tax=Photobacterium kishitanii TaxID=318456 RepID=A0A2T3KLC6_9GAMM|nr:hypothetical protein [Photobacterium kishitanii]PSV00491.1 hypothetical protein C9J27_04985 [Photobacterium kishitanii]
MSNSISATNAMTVINTNRCHAQAVIKKCLKIGCGASHADQIGAAFLGYKNYNTLKGLAAKDSYAFDANLGSLEHPMTVTVVIGDFVSFENAEKKAEEIISACQLPKLEWRMLVNGTPNGYYTSKEQLNRQPINFNIDECGEYSIEYTINDLLINDNAFDVVDYRIECRSDLIDRIHSMLGEAKDSDRWLMKEDIKYLDSLSDEYLLSSLSTNEYIAHSDNHKAFNEKCQEIIDATVKMDAQQ